MKILTYFFLLLAASVSLKAQQAVALSEVAKHVGDSVLVKGNVFGTRSVSGGKLLLINLGAAYPNQLLILALEEPVQQALAEPLKAELGEITVAGKVALYREKPQILIKDPRQIHSLTTERAGTKKEAP